MGRRAHTGPGQGPGHPPGPGGRQGSVRGGGQGGGRAVRGGEKDGLAGGEALSGCASTEAGPFSPCCRCRAVATPPERAKHGKWVSGGSPVLLPARPPAHTATGPPRPCPRATTSPGPAHPSSTPHPPRPPVLLTSADMGRRGGGGALRALDAFPKIADDFAARTASGGAVTLGALGVMGLLFVGELGAGTGWWRDGRWGRRAGAGGARAWSDSRSPTTDCRPTYRRPRSGNSRRAARPCSPAEHGAR